MISRALSMSPRAALLQVEATTVHPTDIVPLQHTTRIGRPRFQGGFLLVNSQPANDVPALEITRARFHGLGWGTLTNYSLVRRGRGEGLCSWLLHGNIVRLAADHSH